MKRILGLALAIIIVIVLLPHGIILVSAEENVLWAVEPIYDDVGGFSYGLAPIKKDGKWGFINKNGNEVIPLKYDDVWGFNHPEGLTRVKKDEKFGFIDITGKEVIGVIYDFAEDFGEQNLAVVKKNDKFGLIDRTGKVVIPLVYDEAPVHSGDSIAVVKDDKIGFIDIMGKEITPIIYDGLFRFQWLATDDLVPVKKDGKWGYIDRTGNEVIPFIYGAVEAFSEGLAVVSIDGEWGEHLYLGGGKAGFIDETGEVVIPFIYDMASSFNNGFALVMNYEKREMGIINKTGKEVIPLLNGWMEWFSEGLVAIYKDGETDENGRVVVPYKAGYMDTEGNEVIPFIYDFAMYFSEGLAAVNTDDNLGYIDKNGDVVIPFKYAAGAQPHPFENGLAIVYEGKYPNVKSGIIDKTGAEIVPVGKYDNIWSFSSWYGRTQILDVARVAKDEKYGLIDKTGTEIIPCIFDDLGWLCFEGLVASKINGKWGFIRDPRIKVNLNGTYLDFDVLPQIIDGITLVPMRTIFEALGAEVEWDNDTQTVYATRKTDTLAEIVSLKIDDLDMTISWYSSVEPSALPCREVITLDVAPILFGGRTLVPARAIAEAFGATVDWDEETQTVIIK